MDQAEGRKPTWNKATLAVANINGKALNAIFSPDKFHRISHVTIAKEAWQILEMTYKGTKKVKDTIAGELPCKGHYHRREQRP